MVLMGEIVSGPYRSELINLAKFSDSSSSVTSTLGLYRTWTPKTRSHRRLQHPCRRPHYLSFWQQRKPKQNRRQRAKPGRPTCFALLEAFAQTRAGTAICTRYLRYQLSSCLVSTLQLYTIHRAVQLRTWPLSVLTTHTKRFRLSKATSSWFDQNALLIRCSDGLCTGIGPTDCCAGSDTRRLVSHMSIERLECASSTRKISCRP